MFRSWFVWACLLPATVLGAQSVPAPPTQSLRHMHHTKWSAENGMAFLPGGQLLQTPDGYLWIGGSRALVRFDGVRFVPVDSTISPVLRSDSTRVPIPLLVDRHGVLWIYRSDGAIVHYRRGVFTLALGPDPRRAQPREATEDGAGRIWFHSGDSLFTFDGARPKHRRLPDALAGADLIGIVPDTGTGIWFGTRQHGLWHLTGDRVERIAVPPGRTPVARPYLQSSDGRLWIWGPEQLMVSDGTRWTTVLADGVNQVAPTTMRQTSNGEILIATQSNGLLRIVGGRTEHYSKRQGLADVVVRDVLADLEGSIWVLSDGALERFRATPFTTLGAADGVPFETPSKLVPDEKGGLWIHSLSDRRLFHASNGIVGGDTGSVRWWAPNFPRRASYHPLGSARGGGVLVWSDTDGVQRVRGRETMTIARASQLDATVTRSLYQDSLGSVWIGYNAHGSGPGFARVTNGVFTPVYIEPKGQRGNVSTIADDGHGHLWVNNTATPVIYKLAGDSVVTRIDSSAGVHAVVTVIVPQGIDTLWMLTNRSSLLRVIGRKVTRVRFDGERDFLAQPWGSLVLDANTMWIATGGGIARLDLASLHAFADGRGPMPRPRVYDASDGLLNGHTPFTVVNAAVAGKDQRVWFSTSGGLAVYDPRFDETNTVPPAVHVEEIVAGGRRLPPAASTIPPQPDRVEIHFTAVSLRAPEKVRLEYMLEGADHDWVAAGTPRVASYTQLRAGHYRFRVRAWNEDGVPSVAEAQFALRVVPAWYEAGWFRGLAVLAALAAGPLVVFRLVQRRAQRREAQLHARFDAALDERNRIARELHDTLLQGFGGITLQLHMIAHTMTKAPAKAAERLERVLGLADDTLIEARQMIWDLRTPELEYQELSAALASAARNAIVDTLIELRFNVRGEERRLPPLVESTALRVGREAATNAARHGQPSLIEMELAYSDRQLDLRVSDDGSGFPVDSGNEHRLNGHWGIAGMRERAARAGGTFDISSTAGGGTTVRLELPIA